MEIRICILRTNALMFIRMKSVATSIATALITSWQVSAELRTATVILQTFVNIWGNKASRIIMTVADKSKTNSSYSIYYARKNYLYA